MTSACSRSPRARCTSSAPSSGCRCRWARSCRKATSSSPAPTARPASRSRTIASCRSVRTASWRSIASRSTRRPTPARSTHRCATAPWRPCPARSPSSRRTRCVCARRPRSWVCGVPSSSSAPPVSRRSLPAMRGRGLVLVLVAAGWFVAGCARTPGIAPPVHDEMVVLLPGADGKTGALTVTHSGQEATLDQPYATARVKDRGEIERGQADPDAVRQAFAPALSAQPPRPVTFRLYFLENSEEFTPESKQEIPKIFAAIAAHPAPEIVVVGHTDRVGSVPYNDALSLRRAERVRNDLVQLGIPRDRIIVAGRGEREPIVPTEDEVDEPRNRGVEITVR